MRSSEGGVEGCVGTEGGENSDLRGKQSETLGAGAQRNKEFIGSENVSYVSPVDFLQKWVAVEAVVDGRDRGAPH